MGIRIDLLRVIGNLPWGGNVGFAIIAVSGDLLRATFSIRRLPFLGNLELSGLNFHICSHPNSFIILRPTNVSKMSYSPLSLPDLRREFKNALVDVKFLICVQLHSLILACRANQRSGVGFSPFSFLMFSVPILLCIILYLWIVMTLLMLLT